MKNLLFLLFLIFPTILFCQTIHNNSVASVTEFASLPIGEQPIRIVHDGNHFYYNNRVGTIYEVDNLGNITLKYNSTHHDLDEIYGMDFFNNKIYVGGLKNLMGDSTWVGYILSVDLTTNAWNTLVKTDTLYKAQSFHDHRLNFVKIQNGNLYAHIASRTNSGELQEVIGVSGTQNLREHPSTGNIYKFPIAPSSTITLQDNLTWINNSGYLMATGLRNAFAVDVDNNGDLYVVVNSDRRDVPEPVYKISDGDNFGFPYEIAGINNPLDNPTYSTSADTLLLDPPANNQGYYSADPNFPLDPGGTYLTPIQNIGPDADKYRNANTGIVYDASALGITFNGISGHKSPTDLCFDNNNALPGNFAGTGLIVNWTSTSSTYMYDIGSDLLSMKILPNNEMSIHRLVSGFTNPMGIIIIESDAYLMDKNKIWKIEFQLNPLPVELVEFESHIENCKVSLIWKSATENSFRNYVLERSYDGVIFKSIKTIEGRHPLGGEYLYVDSPTRQTTPIYYRLKMVDDDNTFSYSNILGDYLNCESIKIYPNPVQDEILIENFEVWENVLIFDFSGKLIRQEKMNDSNIDVSLLPKGTYTLKLTNGNHTNFITWKFLKK